jgi:hypothetical protein
MLTERGTSGLDCCSQFTAVLVLRLLCTIAQEHFEIMLSVTFTTLWDYVECVGMVSRTIAEDAVREVCQIKDTFRINHVIEVSDILSERNRQTINRVLHDLEQRGLVEQNTKGSPLWHSKVEPDVGDDPSRSRVWQQGPIRILHAFADVGVESEALTAHGEVIRVGLDPVNSNQSIPIQADCYNLPFREGEFDLGVLHPECGKFSTVTNISGDPDEWPNQIPRAREIGETYCDHYIIENVPKAATVEDGLQNPDGGSLTKLDGRQFGIPLRFERAFETSFPVEKPPVQQPLEQEISPYFSADRSTEYWRSLKGYSGRYNKRATARNCVPRPMIDFLMRNYWHHVGKTDSQKARSTHSDE